ncbi:hypothetical protein [Ruminococcus flavefaciens]|uniref:Stage III sporulation protein AG n=1 Tax=Ruminococcus flavefaciens 007c TaxID=1341157 RepID=W7UEC3_RUMFL|nr:hypothetical protein [Ruminococcus flavefaciens]EWM53506.1 hypothetical protein RF007C_07440 [Ruminococcus flavefaciens 007c]
MKMPEKLKELLRCRKWVLFTVICGAAGMLLIMLSALIPEKRSDLPERESTHIEYDSSEFCRNTEKRLADQLGRIDGAGEVSVCLTVNSSQRYIYATEGRMSRSGNKSEEEKKYVMTGGGSNKSALIEAVEAPEITGALVLCEGGGSAVVREQMYKAVSAMLGLPTANIFVAKLR